MSSKKSPIKDKLTENNSTPNGVIPIFDGTEGNHGCVPELQNWYGFDAFKDRMCDSPVVKFRLEMASLGYGLNKLINDSSPLVRATVALHDFRPDIMKHDSSSLVRAVVAYNGFDRDLISDSSPLVRSVALRVKDELEAI